MNPLQKFILTTVVLLACGAGMYYFFSRGPSAAAPAGTVTPVIAGATSTPGSQGSAKVTLVTPDYKKPIAFSSSLSAEIRSQLNAELKTVQAELDKNVLDVKAWVSLGSIHKIGGDYAAAAEYWEYIAGAYSGTGAPYYSLGDLYENFLRDYSKAEANYNLAIKVDKKNINAYASLYTMYHYTLHNDTKAAAILDAGLAANPGNNYLLSLKAELNAK